MFIQFLVEDPSGEKLIHAIMSKYNNEASLFIICDNDTRDTVSFTHLDLIIVDKRQFI
ncbi:hypothetical protein FACS1894151_02600 [Spirochaetia bacterium]|nr:hypothetical protein FACS1894151_02600 [Spirochaetia bacterium]